VASSEWNNKHLQASRNHSPTSTAENCSESMSRFVDFIETFPELKTFCVDVLDLNQMEVRPPREIVKIEAVSNEHNEEKYIVRTEPDLADNVLIVGERYQPEDISSVCSCHLGKFSSGVMSELGLGSTRQHCSLTRNIFIVLGLNKAKKTAFRLRENRPIKVYHVTGRFGRATESHFSDSPVTMRATFDHISLNKINSYLASMESSHQKKMFELCGVDLQSQAAFELAVQGPLRPAVSNIPLLYSIRCIEYKKPYFTLGEYIFKSLMNFNSNHFLLKRSMLSTSRKRI
jgi:mitochondrial mRNA pseudouridine synthase TRUB2